VLLSSITDIQGLVTLHRATLNRATVKLRQFSGRQLTEPQRQITAQHLTGRRLIRREKPKVVIVHCSNVHIDYYILYND